MAATMKISLIVLVLQILRLCNAGGNSKAPPIPASSATSKAELANDVNKPMVPSCHFNANNVGFVLSTRYNPEGTEVSIGQDDLSMFVGCPTVFLIHGFTSEHNTSQFLDLIDALLKRKNVNVISVDWREGACSDGWTLVALSGYPKATENTREVGRYVANLTRWLEEERISKINETVLIGHSLGAQISGFAGKAIKEMTGKLYEHIIALDPASPGFESKSCEERICKSDAQFVQAFHTSATLGMVRPAGDADFFFNGGSVQPGCADSHCSHMRCITYMTESLRPNCYFIGTHSDNSFHGAISTSKCDTNKCSVAGLLAPRFKARGSFLVTTHPFRPYCNAKTLKMTP